ncbi:MAG: hypothetical protein INF44_02610 [Thalassospira sp.]|nr:hypothetical protein [Thalassospira sp.]
MDATEALNPSHGEWTAYTKESSKTLPRGTYLVRLMMAGETFDVAYFKGVMPSGEREWILADIRLDETLITHVSTIKSPCEEEEEEEQNQ